MSVGDQTQCSSHTCINDELGQARSVCQPSMEPDWQGPGTNSLTTSRACPGGSSMEATGMVSSVTGDDSRLSTSHLPEEGSDHGHTPRQLPKQLPRSEPPTGNAAYLRQQYKDCQVLEEAIKLLLASWREKSSKTYDSLFGKWVSWCSEWDCDPISCPTGEVVNFFAHLFEHGYQYFF